MIRFSVLVAVYNSAAYLDRCVKSLLSQTLTDVQVVCIDDGSTDDSLRRLQAFAQADKRVEVIALGGNHGQAHARNVGLRQCRGKYIAFVDSDDCLSPDALEQACRAFERDAEVDCVLFNLVRVYPQTGRRVPYSMPKLGAITGREAFERSLSWQIHGVYAVRAEIHMRFPYDESCRAYSDDNTTRLHYLFSRRVTTCPGTYYYYQNQQSVTHGVSMLRFEHIRANESMKRTLLSLNVDSALMAMYETERWLVLVDTYMFYFDNRRQLSRDQRKQALREMRRVWAGMETRLIDVAMRRKFGYCPMRFSWLAFRLQEEAYFFLRHVRNRLLGVEG